MKLQYILLDERDKQPLSNYKPEGAQTKLFSVEEGNCWYVEYSADGKNERVARILSVVDDYVNSQFNIITIQNDSSAYFNNRLYPLVSEFERKLRKILYVFSAKDGKKESNKVTSDLESKDFGSIFTLLFIDESFMTTTKETVKTTNREYFSKAEILKKIESINEATVWDSLLGNSVAPTLRSQFYRVRSIRNDVMHSHNIKWNEYQKARRLLSTIITELDTALNDVSVSESITQKIPSFSNILSNALKMQDSISRIANAIISHSVEIDRANATISKLENIVGYTPELSRIPEIYNDIVQVDPEIKKAADEARRISLLVEGDSQLKAIQEEGRRISGIYNSNPALIQAEQKAIQEAMRLQKLRSSLQFEEQSGRQSTTTEQGLPVNDESAENSILVEDGEVNDEQTKCDDSSSARLEHR